MDDGDRGGWESLTLVPDAACIVVSTPSAGQSKLDCINGSKYKKNIGQIVIKFLQRSVVTKPCKVA